MNHKVSPLYLLPFDSVPMILGLTSGFSQVFPAVLVISIPYLLFSFFRPRVFVRVMRLEFLVAAAVLTYLLFLTIINFSLLAPASLTLPTFVRQLGALVGGLLIYFTFRVSDLTPERLSKFARHLTIFLMPFILFQSPLLNSGLVRVSGLSTEPSHFGNFLVFFVLPALLLDPDRGLRFRIFFLVVNFYLLLTFSLTAYVSAFALYSFWAIAVGAFSFSLKTVWSSLIFISIGASLLFSMKFDFSYVVSNVTNFSSREAFSEGLTVSGSLVDRFYSFWAPFSALFKGDIIFGGGIAGDYRLLPALVSPEIYEIISSVRSGQVGFSSFVAKVITWGGWPLFLGFCLIIFSLLMRSSRKLCACAIPVFISGMFSLGALVVPYVWLWIAILKQNQLRSLPSHAP